MGNCKSQPSSSSSSAVVATPTTTHPKPARPGEGGTTLFHTTDDGTTSTSTATLIQTILPTILPLVCRILNQQLVVDPTIRILHNEKEILYQVDEDEDENSEEVDEVGKKKKKDYSRHDNNVVVENNLPKIINDIQMNVSEISIVSPITLKHDMITMPTFQWPEQDRYETLMRNTMNTKMKTNTTTNNNSSSSNMIVFDICNFNFKVHLGNGIEFVIPVENPFGIPMTLEVGSGTTTTSTTTGEGPNTTTTTNDAAWLECWIPKVRLWILHEEDENSNENDESTPTTTTNMNNTKLYIAFMGRPNIIPHIHVNADRGNGDFCHLVLKEYSTIFDDIIETIIMGFGPTEYQQQQQPQQDEQQGQGKETSQNNNKTKKNNDNNNNNNNMNYSWIGTALGKQISKMIGSSMMGSPRIGNNRPYEVDLTETMIQTINTALGKPRPVDVIQADIETLQKELKRSQQQQQQQLEALEALATKKEKENESSKFRLSTTASMATTKHMNGTTTTTGGGVVIIQEEKKEEEHTTNKSSFVTSSTTSPWQSTTSIITAPFLSCCGVGSVAGGG